MQPEIRFCRTPDGVRLAYATSGSGPPLVCVTNWLTHLNLDWQSPLWSHWLKALSQDHTLARYDGRGTGLSDREIETLSLDAWVQDLETVVDELGLERFPLLGICHGGAVAAAYAARHPERVSRLVLYDSYARGAYADGAKEKRRREAAALEEMIAAGWGRPSAAFRQMFSNLLVPGATLEQQRRLADLQRRTTSAESAAVLWRAFHEIDIHQEARRVKTPTLALHVRGDAMVPFEAGQALAALISGARFVSLQGKNHILLADEPAWPLFLEAVRAFLGVELNEPADARVGFGELTPREREVLALVAQGLRNPEIAEQLHIASKTVRNHVTRIYSKLQADSRAEAVVLAREAGIGVDRKQPVESQHRP